MKTLEERESETRNTIDSHSYAGDNYKKNQQRIFRFPNGHGASAIVKENEYGDSFWELLHITFRHKHSNRYTMSNDKYENLTRNDLYNCLYDLYTYGRIVSCVNKETLNNHKQKEFKVLDENY